MRNLGVTEMMLLGLSYGQSKMIPRANETTLEDFFINRFGNRLYRTFFKDYTEKVWGVPCTEISAEWGAQRIKGLSISSAIRHAVRTALRVDRDVAQKATETSLIERFLYPRLGPGQMWEAAADEIRAAGGEIHLEHRVVAIDRAGPRIRRVQVIDRASGTARWIECDAFISTMPISELVDQLAPPDDRLGDAARSLPYRDFMTAGLVVKRMATNGSAVDGNGMPADNWIYVQEPDVKIGRLQIFNNWSPDLVAKPGTVSLGLEYFCQEGDQVWSSRDADFLAMAAAELEKIGLIDRRDVLDGTVVRVPKAYPAYFGSYREIGRIREFIDSIDNLYAIGRNGMHRYNNQDHSMLAANAAVHCIVSGSSDKRSIWSVNTEEDYHEMKPSSSSAERTITSRWE